MGARPQSASTIVSDASVSAAMRSASSQSSPSSSSRLNQRDSRSARVSGSCLVTGVSSIDGEPYESDDVKSAIKTSPTQVPAPAQTTRSFSFSRRSVKTMSLSAKSTATTDDGSETASVGSRSTKNVSSLRSLSFKSGLLSNKNDATRHTSYRNPSTNPAGTSCRSFALQTTRYDVMFMSIM